MSFPFPIGPDMIVAVRPDVEEAELYWLANVVEIEAAGKVKVRWYTFDAETHVYSLSKTKPQSIQMGSVIFSPIQLSSEGELLALSEEKILKYL